MGDELIYIPMMTNKITPILDYNHFGRKVWILYFESINQELIYVRESGLIKFGYQYNLQPNVPFLSVNHKFYLNLP